MISNGHGSNHVGQFSFAWGNVIVECRRIACCLAPSSTVPLIGQGSLVPQPESVSSGLGLQHARFISPGRTSVVVDSGCCWCRLLVVILHENKQAGYGGNGILSVAV